MAILRERDVSIASIHLSLQTMKLSLQLEDRLDYLVFIIVGSQNQI